MKMKMDAMKHQGKSTLSTEWTKSGRTGDDIGQAEGLAKSQVHKYIRLTELIPKLLDMVDEKRLALSVAVELSYFNKNVQQWLYEYIRENGMIRQEQLMELRQYREDNSMTQERLINILVGSIAKPSEARKIILSDRKLRKYFPAYYSKMGMEKIVFGLLEQWKQAQEGEE